MDAKPRHVLIVSTAELGGAAVESLVGDEAVTMVVVPQVRQSRLQWLANDEDRAHDVAQRASERLAAETPTRCSRSRTRWRASTRTRSSS
jgi:hypothetical protein